MQEIDKVANIIKDGQWHLLEDINHRAKLSKHEIEKILDFLADHSLVKLDSQNRKVKASFSLTKFLKEL